ncbi:MAG: transposase [Akkermansiaceae bacterium]|nr:transposase [Akkermansiaceae bacterium]
MIGEFYVGDRNDGRDYKLLKRMDDDGCGFAIRLMEQAVVTPIKDLALSDEDREAGVVSDQIVRLGAAKRRSLEPVRVIRIEKPEREEPIIIVTNQLDPKDLSARLVGEIYRTRWDIKLFFRWLKCIFGRPMQWHWFAESSGGVGIQLYTALIASLLLARRFVGIRWG